MNLPKVSKKKYKVICYLVGAGPGDPGLLTLRAKSLLEKASVVIHDHLIPFSALDWVPDRLPVAIGSKKGLKTKLIDVGKVFQKTDQKKINTLLLKECRRLEKVPSSQEGFHIVVRLKGGDPFIFSRATEELEVFKKNRIAFEVVPGISSFYAVPAYAGIPMTSREVSRSFSVVTGHMAGDKENQKSQQTMNQSDTMVYLMGIKNLEKIIEANRVTGKSLKTPVAIIENGTLSRQRTFLTTIGEAIKIKNQERITHPGVIVIGEVAKMHRRYSWFEKKPLSGIKVGILRKVQEMPKLHYLLTEKGAETVALPVMSCRSLKQQWKRWIRILLSAKPGTSILFTSSYAVRCAMEAIFTHGYDLRLLGHFKFIVVGEGTHETLKEYRLSADYIPQVASQNGIWELIYSLRLNDIIFPRALVVRNFLEQKMTENKIRFQSVVLYKNESVKFQSHLLEKISSLDYLLLTSSRVVEFLFRQLDAEKKIEKINWPTMIALGEVTYKTFCAKTSLFSASKLRCEISKKPSFMGMVMTLSLHSKDRVRSK